jgi:transaldolase
MKSNPNTRALQSLGQSLWIDNITRTMLADGTLRRYIDELSITGLTSNPTIFEQAMAQGDAYDAQIAELARQGMDGETLFFALAVQDLAQAADLFRPVHDASHGVDGWVSLEVSPLISHDAGQTIAAAAKLHAQSARTNVFIKIPGTREGVVAIEASIFAGVPVNVTLLFSREHYLAVAEAYMRGIERRIAEGLDPVVESVASLFVSPAGASSPRRVLTRSGCCWPALAPRMRRHATLSTSRPWLLRTLSTPCPTKR